MNKHEILLSTGSVPWFGLERAADYAHKIGGKIGKGLQEIGMFVRKTLDKGEPWSA